MDDSNKIPDESIQAALQSEDAGANPIQQNNEWGHPGTPVNDNPAPAEQTKVPGPPPIVSPAQTPDSSSTPVAESGSLADIKQKAIGDLSPLLQHLDQTPEDKFRTTMMMIQATDNQDLISSAYEAANAIPEEKARAQALLDVINEVNYFTQHPA